MSKHTPGPWTAWTDGTSWVEAVEDGRRVWPATDVRERDAALIAAAPDLLAACELAIEALALIHEAAGLSSKENAAALALSAAIAKAKGER